METKAKGRNREKVVGVCRKKEIRIEGEFLKKKTRPCFYVEKIPKKN
jgi:hypothetical protein